MRRGDINSSTCALEVTAMALKKKPHATKCSDHCTLSLIAHTSKIIAKILRKRIESKIEDVLREDQFGFRRGKGTRDATGMLRIISERTFRKMQNCVFAL
jgi:hypothetical protein